MTAFDRAWSLLKWEDDFHPDDLRERDEKLKEIAAMYQELYEKDPVSEEKLQRWMAITPPAREYGATWLGQPKHRPSGNRITTGQIDLEGQTTEEAKTEFEEERQHEAGRRTRDDRFPHPRRHRLENWWLFSPNRGFRQQ
jgi:hypothetical protein